ncbi:putative glucuronosyltransferase [Iris pallida]|uniref:Glucuronosyltransferase n=1 Tax=Iris pallida TaxID=29817 RepID=A0AAX6EQC1_IRIPA|nr:putative glucuronosyltransferase [Iris pallida]
MAELKKMKVLPRRAPAPHHLKKLLFFKKYYRWALWLSLSLYFSYSGFLFPTPPRPRPGRRGPPPSGARDLRLRPPAELQPGLARRRREVPLAPLRGGGGHPRGAGGVPAGRLGPGGGRLLPRPGLRLLQLLHRQRLPLALPRPPAAPLRRAPRLRAAPVLEPLLRPRQRLRSLPRLRSLLPCHGGRGGGGRGTGVHAEVGAAADVRIAVAAPVIPPYVSPDVTEWAPRPEAVKRDIWVFFWGKMEVHPKNVSGRFYGRR